MGKPAAVWTFSGNVRLWGFVAVRSMHNIILKLHGHVSPLLRVGLQEPCLCVGSGCVFNSAVGGLSPSKVLMPSPSWKLEAMYLLIFPCEKAKKSAYLVFKFSFH